MHRGPRICEDEKPAGSRPIRWRVEAPAWYETGPDRVRPELTGRRSRPEEIAGMLRLGSIVMAVAAATFTALLAPTSAAATTWGVPGSGSNVCTVPDPNCDTITQAVTASSSGDTISIGAGNFPVPAALDL